MNKMRKLLVWLVFVFVLAGIVCASNNTIVGTVLSPSITYRFYNASTVHGAIGVRNDNNYSAEARLVYNNGSDGLFFYPSPNKVLAPGESWFFNYSLQVDNPKNYTAYQHIYFVKEGMQSVVLSSKINVISYFSKRHMSLWQKILLGLAACVVAIIFIAYCMYKAPGFKGDFI
jgi:hypothetical protein